MMLMMNIRHGIKTKKHSFDGPASIDRFCSTWNIDGKLHREDGPSIQTYYTFGKHIINWWYIDNVRYKPTKY